MFTRIAPAMKAQYYILRQNGMSAEKAGKIISSYSFEEVNKLTSANEKILKAKTIFEKDFLSKGKILDNEFYSTPTSSNFYLALSDSIVFQFASEEQLCTSLAKTINKICNTCFDKQNITRQDFINGALLIAPIMESCGYNLGAEQQDEKFKFCLTNQMSLAYSTSQLGDDFIK